MPATNLEDGIAAASEAFDSASKSGREALAEGLDSACEYGAKSLDFVGQASEGLLDFIKREPLLAVAGAFIVGYVAAQVIRRISR
jgi:hypothetical protein